MKSLTLALLALSLFGATFAHAMEFTVKLASTQENSNGNYVSKPVPVKGSKTEKTIYEITPATDEVERDLFNNDCGDGVRFSGSILSRSTEFDDENQRRGNETIKVLVRKVYGCRQQN